jgi:hypothetical protein
MRLCTIHLDSLILRTLKMGNNPLSIVLAIRQFSFSFQYAKVFAADLEFSTGYGAHGDYLFGWKEGALQRAMDALGKQCFSETCPVLKLQSSEEEIGCTKPQQAVEDTGTDTCKYSSLAVARLWLTCAVGLKEIPGGPMVM